MKVNYSSLPGFFRSRWMLFWSMLFPQAILALLNLRSWALVSGEVSETQATRWLWVGIFQAALLLISIGWFAVLQIRRREVGWPVSVPVFLLQVGYLWTVTSMMGKLLPDAVTIWILPPHVFMFHQFALVMPAVFYFGFRLACFPMVKHPLADIGITLGAMIGLPLLWWAFTRLLTFSLMRGIPELVWIIFWVGATILAVMAFLRLMMMIYGWVHRIKSFRWILVLLAALVMPLGGMALNVMIPFPVDLQFFAIYALIILNAIALLLPRPASSVRLLLVWLTRCATFAFTLYFFLLFLPFLPLALPAMFAVGAGFLLLAPTLLFAVHVQVLVDEGRQLAAQSGTVRTVLAGIVALAVIPACLYSNAVLDKRSLMGAVDAVYSPDTTQPANINAKRAAKSLERLDAAKAGLYLPFVSGMYQKVVFDGLVLPDHKMAHMYQLLTGIELVHDQGAGRFRGGMLDLWTGSRGTRRNDWAVRPPTRKVDLTDASMDHVVSNGMVHATLSLTVKNEAGNRQGEYIGRLDVPPGVLVTGYWLDVEGERKPGRLYEKRAAMWVYHMIRDMTRRDPGLLIFEEPHRLKLNVFPVEMKEERVSGIEFLLPVGIQATTSIGGRTFSLSPPDTNIAFGPVVVSGADGEAATVWHDAVGDTPPVVERRPCVHLLFDRSRAAADVPIEQWQAKFNALAAWLPQNAVCRVGGVNYAVTYLTDEPIPLDLARKQIRELDSIRAEGGFDPHQAVRRGVATWQAEPVDLQRSRVPIFVFLTGDTTEAKPVGSLAGLEQSLPDAPAYYTYAAGLQQVPFSGEPQHEARQVAAPVPVVLPHVDRADAIVPGDGAVVLATGTADIESDQYVTGMKLWRDWRQTVVNPSLLDPRYAELVSASRDASVMLPVTSFMVVENSAQEAMLERKHKEGSEADSDLDFDEHQESPEPGILWLLIPLVAFEVLRRRKPTCAPRS